MTNGILEPIDYGLPPVVGFVELYSGYLFDVIHKSYYADEKKKMELGYLKRNSKELLQVPEILTETDYYIIKYQGLHRLAKKQKMKPETLWKKLMELHKIGCD